MEVKRFFNNVVRGDTLNAETRTAEFELSNDSIDRHGTILPMFDEDGESLWELNAYKANPIIGYQHDVYGKWFGEENPDTIIGKGKVWIEEGKKAKSNPVLMGEGTFEGKESTGNELAEKIFAKLQFGTLTMTSVGFNPLGKGTTKEIKVGEKDKEIFHYGKRELLEWSIVNIPSNRTTGKRVAQLNSLQEVIQRAEEAGVPSEDLLNFIGEWTSISTLEDKEVEGIVVSYDEATNQERIQRHMQTLDKHK